MRGVAILLGSLIVFSLIIPVSSALNVTARVGETWIVYEWEENVSVDVYIDGIKQTTNTDFSDYYLTNINPDEKHQIKLYNASNTSELLDSLTVSTLHSQTIILLLIVIQFGFIIILLLLKDPVKTILLGGVAAAVCLYTSQVSLGYGALSIIPFVTLIITAIFIAYALWNIAIEKTRW
jgi:hypothetical protein